MSSKIRYLIFIYAISLFFVSCAKKQTYSYRTYNQKYNYTTDTKVKNSKAMHKATMRPYKIKGITYHPDLVSIGDTFDGIASWYGPNYHAKKTSNGEIYNMHALTAAHKTLPMNTIVLVKNIENNKQVVVRINDRGPFVKDRIIDLSYVAGKRIGLDKTGIAPVEIVVLSNPKPKKHYKKISKNGKIKIQIGAFKNIDGAKIFKEEYSGLGKKSFIEKIDGKYKVFIGNFKNRQEAIKFKQKNNIKGFVID